MRTKPSGAIIAGIVVGLLVYGLAGYFLLVSPQKGKAADLKRQTDATQLQIDQYRTLANARLGEALIRKIAFRLKQ